jgi:hypothetical protein
MTRQDFEDILTGPQDLTIDSLYQILAFSRKEKNNVEYKQDFDRNENGKVKLIDFCKVIIGFLNSDNIGSVVVYGIKNAIVNSTDEDVKNFVVGHNISGTHVEELVGYIRERIWPGDIWTVHIKQLHISKTQAVTTIYVGKGQSRPYLYYIPDKPSDGIRSFQRGSAGTYELGAPQLHEFIRHLSTISKSETNQISSKPKAELSNLNKLVSDNLDEMQIIMKDPKQFGLSAIWVAPSSSISVNDEDIESLLNPIQGRRVRVMEELNYAEGLQTSQKWYRRCYVPRVLADENKCSWAITCYRKNGVLITSSLLDIFLKGKKYLQPFHFSYHIQRSLQMAHALYNQKVESLKFGVDFRFLQGSSYISYLYGSYERPHPYVSFSEPIEFEIKASTIQSQENIHILFPEVLSCMEEVARIYGLKHIPDKLTNNVGEMLFVQDFKNER